jgi:hypothetical protein
MRPPAAVVLAALAGAPVAGVVTGSSPSVQSLLDRSGVTLAF